MSSVSTPALSIQLIVEAARALAADEGMDSLTMRSIGDRLGVDPTAMYRHFPNKAELVQAVAESFFAEIVEVEPTGNWQERLVGLWERSTRLAETHPGLVRLLANGDVRRSSLVKINEIIVSCLRDAGLPAEEVGLYHQLILAVMMGEAASKASWGPEADSERAHARRFYGALDPAEAPIASAISDAMFPDFALVDPFLHAVVLDTVERRAKQVRDR